MGKQNNFAHSAVYAAATVVSGEVAVRTPICPGESEPTVSAFKLFPHSNSNPLLKTQLQNVEQTPPPAITDLVLPRVRGYEIVSIIGYGGMGIVYEARHRELNRRVAIKTLRGEALSGPEFRERFRAEAEAIASLQHPNIIQVFEVGTLEQQPGDVNSSPFIALEFMDGGSLMQHCARRSFPSLRAGSSKRCRVLPMPPICWALFTAISSRRMSFWPPMECQRSPISASRNRSSRSSRRPIDSSHKPAT